MNIDGSLVIINDLVAIKIRYNGKEIEECFNVIDKNDNFKICLGSIRFGNYKVKKQIK